MCVSETVASTDQRIYCDIAKQKTYYQLYNHNRFSYITGNE